MGGEEEEGRPSHRSGSKGLVLHATALAAALFNRLIIALFQVLVTLADFCYRAPRCLPPWAGV